MNCVQWLVCQHDSICDPHQRHRWTFQWHAILPWAIALSLWLLHVSGTVCLPPSPRPRHCWLLDGCWRQSCSVAALLIINLCFCSVGLHSDVVWTATLTNFVRCPCSRFWLYATLIFTFIIIIIIIITLEAIPDKEDIDFSEQLVSVTQKWCHCLRICKQLCHEWQISLKSLQWKIWLMPFMVNHSLWRTAEYIGSRPQVRNVSAWFQVSRPVMTTELTMSMNMLSIFSIFYTAKITVLKLTYFIFGRGANTR